MKTCPILIGSLSFLVAACSGGSGGGGGPGGGGGGGSGLALRATDDPFVHEIVEEAVISVDRITVHHEEDSTANPTVLYEGAPIDIVLTDLVDGASQLLVQQDLEPGTYRQIRLRVSSASLLLVNGNAYSTEEDTIHLSSQGTSGFKVHLDPPLVIEEGVTADMLLDFDLTRTFHPIPANDPENANRFNLHPVIRAADLTLTGRIEGTVSQDDGAGGFVPVADATVYALPPGVTDPEQNVASSPTGADGHFTLLGLVPGTYDVLAVKDGQQVSATGVVVELGPSAVVDLVLPVAPTGGIAGFVTTDDGTGNFVPVMSASVIVLPPGDPDIAHAIATTSTDVAGAYAFSGLAAGTYDVRAELAPDVATAPGIVVSSGAVTSVDIVLP